MIKQSSLMPKSKPKNTLVLNKKHQMTVARIHRPTKMMQLPLKSKLTSLTMKFLNWITTWHHCRKLLRISKMLTLKWWMICTPMLALIVLTKDWKWRFSSMLLKQKSLIVQVRQSMRKRPLGANARNMKAAQSSWLTHRIRTFWAQPVLLLSKLLLLHSLLWLALNSEKSGRP